MTVGLPVIVTPEVQISSEIAAKNAGIIVEGKIEALAEAIKQLLVSAKLREDLGANGKKFANQRYTWDTVAHQLVSVYKSIFDNAKLPPHLNNKNLAA